MPVHVSQMLILTSYLHWVGKNFWPMQLSKALQKCNLLLFLFFHAAVLYTSSVTFRCSPEITAQIIHKSGCRSCPQTQDKTGKEIMAVYHC